MVPVSIKTYFYNITKANKEGKITWELFHEFKQFYSMKDLRPDEFYKLAKRIQSDEQLAILYDWNKGRQVQG